MANLIGRLNLIVSEQSLLRKYARKFFSHLPTNAKVALHAKLFEARGQAYIEPGKQFLDTFRESLTFSLDLGFGVPYSETPKVSIVVPVYNNWWTTYFLLQTLRSNREEVPYEIIVVDDESSDMTRQALSHMRGIRVVTLKKNVGYLRATNLGASYARGEYLVLLNNDTVPQEGWLHALVKAMDEDPTIGLAGSNLLFADGLLQESGGQIFADGSGWNIGRGQSATQPEYMFTKEVDYCSAASVIIRRKLWSELGGFDERYVPAYYEDTDLAFQVRRAGFKVVNVPKSVVIHVEGVSHGNSEESGIKSFQVKNRQLFLKKWETELELHWENRGFPRIEKTRDSKGIIILVDRQFPAEYRDSGSIRTIRLAQSLSSLGYHVIVYGDDGSTTTRDHQKLRDLGVETHKNFKTLIQSLQFRGERIKYVWLIRAEVINKYLEKFKEVLPNTEFVCDLLDLEYTEKSKKLLLSTMHREILEFGHKTILVSPFEVELVREQMQSAKISALWKPFDLEPLRNGFAKRSGCIFVGGFRHSPNLEAVMWLADEVLPILRKRGFTECVRIIGSGLDQETINYLEESGLEIFGSVDGVTLVDLYGQSKVGIIPLLKGRGLKGKLAEAASNRVPIVTTSVGAEGFRVANRSGFAIADDAESFATQVMQLCSDQKVWEEASQDVSDFCSSTLGKTQYLKDLSAVLS